MPYFKIRVDVEPLGTRCDDFVLFIQRYSPMLLVEELVGTTNAHYQGMLYSKSPKDISVSAEERKIRDAFKSKFPELVGNKSYSIGTIKPTDEDLQTYITYLCKGSSSTSPPIVVAQANLSKHPSSYHKAYWVKNKSLKKDDGWKKIREICEYPLVGIFSKYDNDHTKYRVKAMLYHKDKNLLQPDDRMLDKLELTCRCYECDTDSKLLNYLDNRLGINFSG